MRETNHQGGPIKYTVTRSQKSFKMLNTDSLMNGKLLGRKKKKEKKKLSNPLVNQLRQ